MLFDILLYLIYFYLFDILLIFRPKKNRDQEIGLQDKVTIHDS